MTTLKKRTAAVSAVTVMASTSKGVAIHTDDPGVIVFDLFIADGSILLNMLTSDPEHAATEARGGIGMRLETPDAVEQFRRAINRTLDDYRYALEGGTP